jgi:hypothetical protein
LSGNQPRHGVEEAEHPHMRADPVRQRSREGRFGIGAAGDAELSTKISASRATLVSGSTIPIRSLE